MSDAAVMHRAALFYARLGWRVFPVVPRAKLPAIKRWPERATIDARQIAEWWQRPGNIGVACGAASGVFVLDVDQRDDVDGEAALEQAQADLGPLPNTAEQRTGSGGRQLFFAYPPGRKLRNKQASQNTKRPALPPGLDTRGEGGFAVLPPSIHPCGEQYRWVAWPHKIALAELPERWIARLEVKEPPRITVPITPLRSADEQDIGPILDRVQSEGQGNRNALLFWAAKKLETMNRCGLVRHDWTGELMQAARNAGLDEMEARRTLASGRRHGGAG